MKRKVILISAFLLLLIPSTTFAKSLSVSPSYFKATTTKDTSTFVDLSWKMDEGEYGFSLSKECDGVQTLLKIFNVNRVLKADNFHYLDTNVEKGKSYIYTLFAYDKFSNVSQTKSTSVTIDSEPDGQALLSPSLASRSMVSQGGASIAFAGNRKQTQENFVNIGSVVYKLSGDYLSANDLINLKQNSRKINQNGQSFLGKISDWFGSVFTGGSDLSLEGIIPDNGQDSQLIISELNAGKYTLTLMKDNFKTVKINLILFENENLAVPQELSTFIPINTGLAPAISCSISYTDSLYKCNSQNLFYSKDKSELGWIRQ